ncbi:MAG: GNAT family N-acetyltransferase [Clostridiales bacterium]|jgi:GNAT superfamily N-acetyltransferase|nr:GNAT family N-acetyltransferase [Clostridiales bacterium]
MKSQDYYAFQKAGLADIYETIGNYHLFMVCEAPNLDAFRELPEGYTCRLCRQDELEIWKRVAADEAYVDYVTDYYDRVYKARADEFFQRCTFACDENDNPVATSMVCRSYGLINNIGWTRTLPQHEGKGLGRGLLSKIMADAEYPIYLHTQPSSIRAVKLYSDFGFKLITNPVIGHRPNDLAKSLPYLKRVMPAADYAKLQFTEADEALHKAALTREYAEF